MKKILFYSLFLSSLAMFGGCDKTGNYPGATVSPYMAMFDLRDLYKGSDVRLSPATMFGSNKITGVVVSDHSGGNLPTGLLVIQDRRRLSELRGISLAVGAEAAKYVPGDSVIVNVEGGVLTRVEGILQVTGVAPTAITKVSSGNTILVNRVASNLIMANPERYESVLVSIVKAGFNPIPSPSDVLAGDKFLNDGFGDLPIRTEPTATFANSKPLFLGNYTGIIFSKTDANKQVQPQIRVRTASDIVLLSSTVELTPIIISGFISDVAGGDGNYEYVQLLATRDINFAVTPFSLVTSTNATASTPTGVPVNGWATGQLRTYKINLTSGFAAKGTFFYVGGINKLINGASSTSISGANWIKNYDYVTRDGEGFGTKTGGLLANSGNASGLAVFEGITVTETSKPVDVLFVSTGGTLYSAGPPARGYRIANTDWYDVKNPITLQDQPFYRSGTNTLNMSYTTADQGFFYKMGGEYNVSLGRWMKARTQTNVLLTKSSTLAEIEGAGSTKLLE
jgi:hypothetical protein